MLAKEFFTLQGAGRWQAGTCHAYLPNDLAHHTLQKHKIPQPQNSAAGGLMFFVKLISELQG
jgi:hypothetical protein